MSAHYSSEHPGKISSTDFPVLEQPGADAEPVQSASQAAPAFIPAERPHNSEPLAVMFGSFWLLDMGFVQHNHVCVPLLGHFGMLVSPHLRLLATDIRDTP